MHKPDPASLLELAGAILREPTAPFHETRVRAAIARLLGERCPHVTVAQDAFGNLVARYRRGENPAPARWAFVAHMDHPGWVRTDAGELEFFGGVPKETQEANRARVEDFGPFAMWAFPACEVRLAEDKIYSRACDDLIGCVAIVGMFLELERTGAECQCVGLFTRAEEVGFVGAVHAAKDGWLQREELTAISLETSAERPPARQGAGPIVRVGDRSAIFDPAVTAELLGAARDAGIEVQRCLMPGGTCEATAFQAYGVRTGALCIALGNYHNCVPDAAPQIGAESVSISDLAGLVAVCAAVAPRPSVPDADALAAVRERIEDEIVRLQPFFTRDQTFS